ncbi:MAG: DUF433 domain-containing protein [Rubrivivax sp.]
MRRIVGTAAYTSAPGADTFPIGPPIDRTLGMPSVNPLITTDPQRRGGRPCIRDLRISVGDVLGWLAAGMTHAEILADYPELTEADIRASLAYAAERESREVRIVAAA